MTRSGGRVCRRKQGIGRDGAQCRRWKLRGQPKSVRAPSWRSQVVSALQELSKTLRSFRSCARLHTHAQTHTLAHTHSHPLPPTPETLGELKARALRSSPQPSSRGRLRGCVRNRRAQEALTRKRGPGGAGTPRGELGDLTARSCLDS